MVCNIQSRIWSHLDVWGKFTLKGSKVRSISIANRANRSRISACKRDEETEKKLKKGKQRSWTVTLHHCMAARPVNRSQPNLCVCMSHQRNYVRQMVSIWKLVFLGRHVEKRMFLSRKTTAYMTMSCATALAYDTKKCYVLYLGKFNGQNNKP